MTIEEETENGINQALANANPIWSAKAYGAIIQLARSGRTFTADDVWPYLVGVETFNHKAMGGVFLQAKRDGLISQTGSYRVSVRRVAHKRPLAVWRGNAPELPR